MWICGKNNKPTNHFLIQCSCFLKEKKILLNEVRDIDSSLIDQNEMLYTVCYTLLFSKENTNGSKKRPYSKCNNRIILSTTKVQRSLFE